RESPVLRGFVKTPELALGDSPRRPGVGELPSGAELGEYRHGLVEPGDGLLTPAEVVEHPRLLHVSVGDAELVAALLGELARILDELQRPLDRKISRMTSSIQIISYDVYCFIINYI